MDRWGEAALQMDGCQAGMLKFNVTPGAFFFCPAEKAKGHSETGFFSSFKYLIIPGGRNCLIIIQKTKTETYSTWMQLQHLHFLECFDWGTVSVSCSHYYAESVLFFNANVSRSAFAHLCSISRIGSKLGGLLKIHCYQDAWMIPWKAPSWSNMLQL